MCTVESDEPLKCARKIVALNPSQAYEKELLENAFRKRSWEIVEDVSVDTKVHLQWAKARDVEWDRVLDGYGSTLVT
eukprot:7069242-Pyramimonas_sp.AAC.1